MENPFTKIIDLLLLARQSGVEVILSEERLQLKAGEDVEIDEQLLNEIRSNKQSIIEYLASDDWQAVTINGGRNKISAFDRTSQTHIPVSFSQERLWFIDRLGGSIEYHSPTILRLTGNVDINALSLSLHAIIDRHEVLRTIFYEHDGKVYQLVKESNNWDIEFANGSAYLEDEAALQLYINSQVKKPFNLAKDFPIRTTLISLTDQEYILVLTIHHIASDAWSTGIIVAEAAEFYSAYTQGHDAKLAKLPLQYADFSVWQRNYLQGDVLQKKINYWKNKLNEQQALLLPVDNTRSSLPTTYGASSDFKVDQQIMRKLHEIARQQNASLYMVLLAAFKVLLYRYSGQQDITVGTSIATRQQKELEGLIGFFVNTLALRDHLNPDAPFTTLLQEVKNTMLGAYENQDIPFEKVVEVAAKDRDPERNPLFQVMLVLNNTPETSKLVLGDVKLKRENFTTHISKFEITFFITESPGGLSGHVDYRKDLFNAAFINGMLLHYVTLLHAIAADPHQKAGLMTMLQTEELQLLQTFNNDKVDYPRDKTTVDLFEEQVTKTPNAAAIVFEEATLTYTQLNERSNQLAHYLISRGIKPDAPVPLFMERSDWMIIGMLGIMKAGAAYVPIDMDFPADRISYMLQDLGATMVVSSSAVSGQLDGVAAAEVIEIDQLNNQQFGNPVIGLLPHHLAYVIYTSGSTGRPKGVMIEHRNLADYYFGLKKSIQIDQCRSFALVSTIATDLGNTVIYGSLLSGGALHILSKESVSNIEYLHRYFKDKEVDCVKIVPSHWRALRNEDTLLMPEKLLIFGGETLPWEFVHNIQQSGAACRIVNHYGPTETTIGKLLHEVQPGKVYHQTIPIGQPFSNTAVYILSAELQLCPVSVPGQLYIAGDGVAKGYYQNELLTQEKFIADPFNPGNNTKMYGTGDRVKWLPDGNISFIGRVDDQVKIRGYRVEPGEIERILQQNEGVRAAVVVAQKDKQGNNRLIGYIVPEGPLDRKGLTAYLIEKLPEYMIPAILMEIENIPLTANGKTDRKALPNPDEKGVVSNEYVAPRNDIEERMASVWANVLEVDEIGIYNDFFELGGHSLLAVRLVSAIRKTFDVEVPIGHVFDFPTVAALSAQLFTKVSAVLLPLIGAEKPRPQRIPLSFSQERLWFIDSLEGSVQYHVPAVLRLKGQLNRDALANAFKAIVNRHEVLRTVIKPEDGSPYQYINEKDEWTLTITNGADFAGDSQKLQDHIESLIRVPFNLSLDSMLRANLICVAEDEHVLIAVLHHIASDGWSKSVLVKELVAFYSQYNEQAENNLEALPVQYADFAIWQRNYLQGETLQRKLEYWKEQLEGVEALNIQTDYARPAVWNTSGAILNFTVDKDLSAQLHAFSLQHGVTLYMTLLTVFKVLLYRYSGQQDICVGTPVAGRQQHELEELIGFFVNTLALRSKVEGDATFLDFLQQVKTTTLAAYEHQDVPFEKVVDMIVKERDMSGNPLFQVMFILRNTPEVPDLRLGEIQLSSEGHQHATALFDIAFFLTETPQGLRGSVEYSTALFSKETIERFIGHYQQLLISVIDNPERAVGLLPLLTQREQQQLLVQFNDTTADYSKENTIISLFEEQVLKAPDEVAVVFEKEQITYQELNAQANRLARYLRCNGVTENTLVPICVERGIDMIVGILGILKAGAAYVPIDPAYPEERIRYMLQDTAAQFVVSNRESREHLQNISIASIIEINGDCETMQQQSSENIFNTVKPGNLAYIIYTSGSTGRPKGVRMPGRALVNLLSWQQLQFVNKNRRRVLQFASINFDVSFQEIFSTLCFGNCLYLINAERRKNVTELLKDVEQYGITHLFLPYIVLKALADYAATLAHPVSSLQEIITAGEQVKLTKDIRQLLSSSNIKLINQYGPTEAHVVSSYTIDPDSSTVPDLPPIGKPISNTFLYILDSNQQIVPVGVTGELYIGGQQVAHGYLNLPELTAERFMADPFSRVQQARMYKTGDLTRWLPDGNIEYLGRIDTQVKIRGYRIELGEIESVLEQSGLVSGGVVIDREDNQGVKHLVGYVVADSFDQEAIITYLRLQLPDYMVPLLWVPLERLPLTANGKVDKTSLPNLESGSLTTNEYIAPRNELEAHLKVIWMELLHRDTISVKDNFFDLGGHSLLVMRVVSAIRRQLQVELSVKELFLYPTIELLAGHIKKLNVGLSLPAVEVMARPANIPLSFSQERLWFIDRLQGSQQYHIPAVLRIRGKLNDTALSNALQQIVYRHEVLRTVIREKEGIGFQSVKEAGGWQLQVADGSIYKNNPENLQQYIKAFIEAPFNLSEDYMLRAVLISLENEEHVLATTLHHIASDGWSNSILVNELTDLYNAAVEKRPVSLLPLPVQYADYAIWQYKYLQGEAWEKKLGYWKEKLEGTALLQLRTDYKRSLIQSMNGAVTGSKINRELLDKLHALCRQQGTTLFMTLLATFKVLLYRYSGQEDICVGTPIAGRQQHELERLIGFFVNTLALRSQVDGSTSFAGFLQQIKSTTLEAYDHQEIPFEKVVETVVKERDMSRSPLFQVMFVLQNTPEIGQLRLGDLQLSNDISGSVNHATSKFDLIFNVSETAGGLTVAVEYCTDLYKQQTVRRMMAHFTQLLHAVVTTPQQSIDTLTMLREDEQQLMLEFNNTSAEYPEVKSIIDLFEAQAEETPELVAVVFEKRELTYKALNSKANQLANHLRNKGVVPGMLVPLFVERSLEMVISVLAILKAGAAYVPIDLEYPAERIRYILEDTGAILLISNKEKLNKLPPVNNLSVVDISEDGPLISAESTANLHHSLDPENLVYVLYTSGSTGRPKGVRMPGSALVNLLSWQQKQFANKNGRRVLQFASLSFDVSFQEIFSTLCFGNSLYLISAERRKDVTELLKDVKHYGITHLFLPYIILKTLAEYANTVSSQLSSLQEIITAGEQLKLTEDIRHLLNSTNIKLTNQYGPTEAHVVSSYLVDTDNSDMTGLPPIGKPIDNTYLYVLGPEQQFVPIGVPGELYIGGVQVALGYLNLPELTNDRFMPDPFSKEQGARMYKTGDLACWLPDGNIEYLGRADEQLKIRGYRVEPGEIEAVLQQNELVNQAVIVAKNDNYGNKYLVAYVVPADGFDREVFKSHLQTILPAYMIPAIWVEMERLPVNKNGKVDKNALPEPELLRPLTKQYDAPRNDMEISLTEIWQELLGVKQISIHDNFFELGGHSLSALKLVWQIQKKLNVNIRVNAVFIYPTIAALAGNIAETADNSSLPFVNIKYLVPIKTVGDKPPLYFVAGGGGTALKIKSFAKLLHSHQPVYVFQPPFGIADLKDFPDTIEEIAAIFIKELLVQNPDGPYALSGHCVGGVIAFEMAQQLQAMGRKVHSLIMFDTIMRKKAEREPGALTNLYHIPLVIKSSVSRIMFKVSFHSFLLRKHTLQSIRYRVDHFRTLRKKNKRKKIVANDLKYAGLEIFDESSDVYLKALRNYKLLPYNGDILLFYATEHYFFFDKENNISYKKMYLDEKTKNNWKEYATNISIYVIKGEHADIFDPIHGVEFANTLQRHLNK